MNNHVPFSPGKSGDNLASLITFVWITWAHPSNLEEKLEHVPGAVVHTPEKFGKHKFMALLLLLFKHQNINVQNYFCVAELHQSGKVHFHAGILFNQVMLRRIEIFYHALKRQQIHCFKFLYPIGRLSFWDRFEYCCKPAPNGDVAPILWKRYLIPDKTLKDVAGLPIQNGVSGVLFSKLFFASIALTRTTFWNPKCSFSAPFQPRSTIRKR